MVIVVLGESACPTSTSPRLTDCSPPLGRSGSDLTSPVLFPARWCWTASTWRSRRQPAATCSSGGGWSSTTRDQGRDRRAVPAGLCAVHGEPEVASGRGRAQRCLHLEHQYSSAYLAEHLAQMLST